MSNKIESTLLKQACENPPLWAGDILESWSESLYREKEPFVVSHYWTGQGSVNVFNVAGTMHSDYQNGSWLQLLQTGKRMHLNLPLLESNPGYYQETSPKEPMMYFKTWDGIKFYIGDDGNHRTCIARFHFYDQGLTQLHGVTIDHYQVDEVLFQVYQELKRELTEQKLFVLLTPQRELLRREDTAGWKTDHYQIRLLWDNRKTGKSELLDLKAAQDTLECLYKRKQGFWSKLFNPII